MPSPPTLDDHLAGLQQRLATLEARVAALESRAAAGAQAPELPVAGEPERLPASVPALFDPVRVAAALGRSLIILGGAFLLRALTEAGTWAVGIGVSIGLAYAAAWVAMSARAARRGDRLLAAFDGGIALVIACPLIVEAAFKFQLLGPGPAMLALGAFSALILVMAGLTGLRVVTWMAALAGTVTGLTLMIGSGVVAPFALYATGLGVGTLWLAYLREWKLLRWGTGVVAVIGVVGVTLRAVATPPRDPASLAWACQAALILGYLGSIAIRTLVRGRQVVVFEIVQTVLVLAAGLGGAVAVEAATGSGGTELGAVIIVLGLAAYVVAFQFLARHAPGAWNFYFYSSLALVFVMTAAWTALGGAPRAVALIGVTALLAVAWVRSRRATLLAHTALALLAAAQASGLLAAEWATVAGAPPALGAGGWPLMATLALALMLTASGLLAMGPRPGIQNASVVAILIVAWGGIVALAAWLLIEAVPGAGESPAVLATVRTAVLSLAAVAAAFAGRVPRLAAASSLAVPLLLLTGAKLMFSDLMVSNASTLFIAFACYGLALVLAPRVRRGEAA